MNANRTGFDGKDRFGDRRRARHRRADCGADGRARRVSLRGRREHRERGVLRVNAIAPSAVETEMIKDVLTPDIRASVLARFPLGRFATADDVAHLAVYLASDLASFITGETVAVDGGFLKT